MIAMIDNPVPAVLKSHAHCLSLEMAAQRIALMLPAIREACAPSPAAVWGDCVPFDTFNEAARFVITNGGCDKSRNATAVQIRRASKIGAVAYGIRWKRHPNQRNGPIISCKRGRPPTTGGRTRRTSIAVRRLDSGKCYNQIMDAARDMAADGKCDVKAAFTRIQRAMKSGRRVFGTVWRPAQEFELLIPEWASA
jgi:hypothetical protein